MRVAPQVWQAGCSFFLKQLYHVSTWAEKRELAFSSCHSLEVHRSMNILKYIENILLIGLICIKQSVCKEMSLNFIRMRRCVDFFLHSCSASRSFQESDLGSCCLLRIAFRSDPAMRLCGQGRSCIECLAGQQFYSVVLDELH